MCVCVHVHMCVYFVHKLYACIVCAHLLQTALPIISIIYCMKTIMYTIICICQAQILHVSSIIVFATYIQHQLLAFACMFWRMWYLLVQADLHIERLSV